MTKMEEQTICKIEGEEVTFVAGKENGLAFMTLDRMCVYFVHRNKDVLWKVAIDESGHLLVVEM